MMLRLIRRSFCTNNGFEFPEIMRRANGGLDMIEAILNRPEEQKRKKIQQDLANQPDLWEDPKRATEIVQKLAVLEERGNSFQQLKESLEECQELYTLAQDEQDIEVQTDCLSQASDVLARVLKLRVAVLLSDSSDSSGCYLELQAGAGGTESCDWVQILFRMYTRWAENKGYKVEISSQSPGEEAGFKSVMLRLQGPYAYGWSKTEAGVHRLVRVSPFDSQSRRHTSFAQVRVYPEVTDADEILINAKDLRIDTFRASGAGGQHVNTTDSAVRITHTPTGTVTQCQNQRSQHQNKAVAMDMLRSKLVQRELENTQKERAKYAEGLGSNEWGSQIRSYVLHPYQMVKDHRTSININNAQSVLDGDLTELIEAALTKAYQPPE